MPTTTKEGVKFVLKAMKAERKKNKGTAKKGKGGKIGGNFMVVPPHSFAQGGQKKEFIEWGCSPLVGFGLRSAGGGVVFLQMQRGKMDALYDVLEGVFKEIRRREKEAKENDGGDKEGKRGGRRRSKTYPTNKEDAYDPVGDAMDLVTEGLGDMRVDGGLESQQLQGRIRKGPRPSYSPTPTMNVNMGPASDYLVRRRRLSSPHQPATEVNNMEGGSPVKIIQHGSTGGGGVATDTPMVKRVYWGSQPLGNRDWGGSAKAGEEELDRMKDFLTSECGSSGGSDAASVSTFELSHRLGSVDKRGGGMGMLVRSNTLTFDDEVEQPTPGRRSTGCTDDMEEDTDETEDEKEEDDEFGDVFGGDGFDDEPLQPLGGIGGGRTSRVGKGRRSSSMFVKRER